MVVDGSCHPRAGSSLAGQRRPRRHFGNGGPDTASVALAWSALRWKRKELVWVVYGSMALAAWKLVARDFRDEHSLALVASLMLYGGTLILLPRILQRKARA